MNYKYPLTILTPTYNRKDTMKNLYDSLANQTYKNFQWLIIDDGSVDGTGKFIETLPYQEFEIEYHYKDNGGKHTALNYSHSFIKGKLICIVDSDDWLLPNAISKIIETWELYCSLENVKCLTFLKGKNLREAMNCNFPKEPTLSNHIEFRVNGARRGDCCEVLMSDVLKEFPFPEYKGETFLGEGYLWNHIGFRYQTVYINEIIYICEYMEGGLTKSGRRLRLQSPKGGMENSNSFMEIHSFPKVIPRILRKEAWLFICYGKFAGYGYEEILEKGYQKSLIRKNYIFGVLLYYYWKIKYL